MKRFFPLFFFALTTNLGGAELRFAIPYLIQQAYIDETGDVHVIYEFEIQNDPAGPPIDILNFSFPTPVFDDKKVAPFISLQPRQTPAEKGEMLLEEVSGEWTAIPWQHYPAENMETEIQLLLSDHPISPGAKLHFKIEAWFRELLFKDTVCANYAMLLIRPPYFWGSHVTGPTYLTLNVLVPRGILRREVLGQLTWPEAERYRQAEVVEEDGQTVVRWSEQKPLTEIYWLSVLFPANNIKRALKPAYDPETDMPRSHPVQDLKLDAYLSEDGSMRLEYDLSINNQRGCMPIKSVQIIVPGKWSSMEVTMNGKRLSSDSSCNDYDQSLWSSAGDHWYSCQELPLIEPIPPGEKGNVKAEVVLREEVELEGSQATVRLNASFSAARAPYDHCATFIRMHFPGGVSLNHLSPKVYGFTEKDETSIYWEQEKPEPILVDFTPTPQMRRVAWKNLVAQWMIPGIFAALILAVLIWRLVASARRS